MCITNVLTPTVYITNVTYAYCVSITVWSHVPHLLNAAQKLVGLLVVFVRVCDKFAQSLDGEWNPERANFTLENNIKLL